ARHRGCRWRLRRESDDRRQKQRQLLTRHPESARSGISLQSGSLIFSKLQVPHNPPPSTDITGSPPIPYQIPADPGKPISLQIAITGRALLKRADCTISGDDDLV